MTKKKKSLENKEIVDKIVEGIQEKKESGCGWPHPAEWSPMQLFCDL